MTASIAFLARILSRFSKLYLFIKLLLLTGTGTLLFLTADISKLISRCITVMEISAGNKLDCNGGNKVRIEETQETSFQPKLCFIVLLIKNPDVRDVHADPHINFMLTR